MYYEIVKENGIGSTNKWSWLLKSKEHQVIAKGASYFNKLDCVLAISLARGTSIATPIIEH